MAKETLKLILEDLKPAVAEDQSFKLVIPDLKPGGRLPRNTGEAQGALKEISPPLEWYRVPDGTKSLALLVQDIDAPDPSRPIKPWTHWVVINIPASLKGLPAGFSRQEEEMGGDYAVIKEGINDWKVPGWRGPKPPCMAIGTSSSSLR